MRTEVIGNATLYLGNCLEILPTLAYTGEADVIITDPPYGVGFAEWDKNIPEWFAPATEVTDRIVFTTAPTTVWSYPRPDWLGCIARPGQTSRTAQGGFNHWIPIMIYGVKFSIDMRYLPPIANVQKREYEPGFIHPCPKPVELMKWLIAESSEARETILDPFMGSGTTGVACVDFGRPFIGIEINPEYFDFACRRIEKAMKQGRLFA